MTKNHPRLRNVRKGCYEGTVKRGHRVAATFFFPRRVVSFFSHRPSPRAYATTLIIIIIIEEEENY